MSHKQLAHAQHLVEHASTRFHSAGDMYDRRVGRLFVRVHAAIIGYLLNGPLGGYPIMTTGRRDGRPMTDDAVFAWLEQKTGILLTPGMRTLIREEGYLATALDPDDSDGLQDCLDATRRYLRAIPANSMVPPTAKQPSRKAALKSVLEPEEDARAGAFSSYLAGLAANRFGVPKFRSEILGGKVLSQKTARKWLQTPTFYFFGKDQLVKAGVPILKHTATAKLESTVPLERGRVRENYLVHAKWRRGSASLPVGIERDRFEKDVRSLPIPGQEHGYFVFPLSIFDRLLDISLRLAGHYPWTVREAVWFVLTGVPPSVPAIDFEFPGRHCDDHVHGALVIHVEPWVSEKSVSRLYRRLQKHVFGARRNRQLTLSRLNRVAYTSTHPFRTWQEAFEDWNRNHSDDRQGEISNYCRDYLVTARRLAFPAQASGFFKSGRLEELRKAREDRR